MPALPIRNIPEDIHRELKALTPSPGQSTEAEVRAILAVAKIREQLKMGQAFWELGRKVGLTNDGVAAMDAKHDSAPAEPLSFEQ